MNKIKVLGIFTLGFILGGISLAIVTYYNSFEPTDEIKSNYSKIVYNATKRSLYSIVLKIEFYNLLNGKYPSNLSELNQLGNRETNYIDLNGSRDNHICEFYYYFSDITNTYLLFSAGDDQTIFTDDDIYPSIKRNKIDKLGLSDKRDPKLEYPELQCNDLGKPVNWIRNINEINK